MAMYAINSFVGTIRQYKYSPHYWFTRKLVPQAEKCDLLNLAEWGLGRDPRSLIYALLNDLDIFMCHIACRGKYDTTNADVYVSAASAYHRLYMRWLAQGYSPQRIHLEFALLCNNIETVKWFSDTHPKLFDELSVETSSIVCLQIAIQHHPRVYIGGPALRAMCARGNIHGAELVKEYDHSDHDFELTLIANTRRPVKLTTPLHIACAVYYGRMDLLNSITDKQIQIDDYTYSITSLAPTVETHHALMSMFGPPCSGAPMFAISYMNIELFNIVKSHGVVTDDAIRHIIHFDLVEFYECVAGHICHDVWTRQMIYYAPGILDKWANSTMCTPAKARQFVNLILFNSRMDVLKMLVTRGYIRACDVNPAACLRSFAVNKFMHEHGLFIPSRSRLFKHYCKYVDIDHAIWLHSIGITLPWSHLHVHLGCLDVMPPYARTHAIARARVAKRIADNE